MDDISEWIAEVKVEDLPHDNRELARIIGIGAYLLLAQVAGGTAIYVPKLDRLLQVARDRRLIKEFNGSNYKDLALKYNLSEAWVRQVIQQDQIDKAQIKLFEEAM